MTFLLETLRLGLANIMLHKLRSLLTALGIIIGVGAVVAISAYGEGSKRAALAGIRELGANNILLTSVKPPDSEAPPQEDAGGGGGGGGGDDGPQPVISGYGLTWLDLTRLEASNVGPFERIVPLKQVGSFIYRGAKTVLAARVFGTTPELFDTLPMTIARGRTLDVTDENQFTAVLGADAASHLFRLEDPLGGTFSIDGTPFTVVGILEPLGVTAGRDINLDIYIPMKAAEVHFGDQRMLPGGLTGEHVELSALILRVEDTRQVLPVAARVRRVIDAGHDTSQDVQVKVPLELIQQEEETENRNNRLMVVVGALSLLVGGIGIMNIMLASVTERTREIGIRRALGATRLHIVAQFLVETTVLAGVGGVIGLGLASLWCLTHVALIDFAVADAAGSWGALDGLRLFFMGNDAPILMPIPMIVGFAFAAAVGVVFGVYPAIKAAKQDPIVALRHD